MSKKQNGVNHSMTVECRARRKGVVARLEAQLKQNSKTVMYVNDTEKKIVTVPLTEKDIARINSELEILKTRL